MTDKEIQDQTDKALAIMEPYIRACKQAGIDVVILCRVFAIGIGLTIGKTTMDVETRQEAIAGFIQLITKVVTAETKKAETLAFFSTAIPRKTMQ